jgi:hypothetical protein
MATNDKITYEDVFDDEEWEKPIYPCWSITVGEDGDFQRFEIGQEEEIITELNYIKENINEYIRPDYEEDDITITLFMERDEIHISSHYETTIKIKHGDNPIQNDFIPKEIETPKEETKPKKLKKRRLVIVE